MSAAIGTAEMAVEQGAYKIPAGSTPESVSAMIALGYGDTMARRDEVAGFLAG